MKTVQERHQNLCPVCNYPLSRHFVTIRDEKGTGVFVDTACAIEKGWIRRRYGKIVDQESPDTWRARQCRRKK